MTKTGIVGKDVDMLDHFEKVKGEARYCGDIKLPGMLVGKLLYSPYPCARINSIDITKAQAIPDVVAIMLHTDVPGENSYFHYIGDQPLLVSDMVRYQGDAVAAVAARTETAADLALEAIEVAYESVEGIFDPEEAMKPGARQVWPDRDNVFKRLVLEEGDVETGFDKADVIVEGTYQTPFIEPAFLEPEGAVAYQDFDGTMVVYASTQAPFEDRMQIARALGIPQNMVRVITPAIGGGFGGKHEAHVQIHAALLAQTTGLPVRIIRSREESILTHVKRVPITMHLKLGATDEGEFVAYRVKAIGDMGPYVNAGAIVMTAMASKAQRPYNIPNLFVEAYSVLTNNPISGAMRGFGSPQIAFAREGLINVLAGKLQIDPVQLRLQNLEDDPGVRETLERAAELSGWKERKKLPPPPKSHLRRGWGVSTTFQGYSLGGKPGNVASAGLEVNTDGTATLYTSAVNMGQGSHTTLAQMAAEALGLDFTTIRVVGPDTFMTKTAGPAVASRSTFMSGRAIMDAAEPIRRSLLETAAEMTGIAIDMLHLEDSKLYAEGEQLSIPIHELAHEAESKNRRLQAEGFFSIKWKSDLVTGATMIAQVLVDLDTGQVTVEKMTNVMDTGKIVNPRGASGQAEGGAVMGLGYALYEELLVDKGTTLNPSLSGYLIPTVADLPDMEQQLIEVPEPKGPYGAKGIGELPTTVTAAAIANAVSDAIGVPVRQIPITAERVWKMLEEKDQQTIESDH
jgi:CO/xanthine dehydrogenase Mo-binding subunit